VKFGSEVSGYVGCDDDDDDDIYLRPASSEWLTTL
jgi:hypothetical protein